MAAAFQVISTEGLGQARLKDIAGAAGVSLGSVQHYFRHRDSLVTETFRSLIELSGATWRLVSEREPDPLRRLLALLRFQVTGWAPFEQRWSFWLEFWSASRRIPELEEHAGEIYSHWQEPFEAVVSEGRARRVFTPVLPSSDLSLKLMALVDGLAVRVLVDRRAVGEEEMADLLTSTACADLGVAPAEREAALQGLPRTIGLSYPGESPATAAIDWSPLDR